MVSIIFASLANTFPALWILYGAFQVGGYIATTYVLPAIDLQTGVINSGFSLLTHPFIVFFNAIMNWIVTPIVVLGFIALFFIIQILLFLFYGWIAVKGYQIYLAFKHEDFIHLLQHPSVSFAHIKKNYDSQNSSSDNASTEPAPKQQQKEKPYVKEPSFNT